MLGATKLRGGKWREAWCFDKHASNSIIKGTLSDERTRQLEEAGFVWDASPPEWEENLERMVRYREEHGDYLMPIRYGAEDFVKHGYWVNWQR